MRLKITLITALLAGAGCFIGNTNAAEHNSKPNIIYILADDLGYGELGCYGQTKIETPNIDKLAQNGVRFTQHYAGSAVCAPSRCVLLTGKHTGHAAVRNNNEWRERGDVWNYHAMNKDPKLEGQWPLPANTVTIGTLLQSAGYTTACVGKWGLGAPFTEGVPTKQGFDFFYGYNCQRQAHTYYPHHLWRNEERVLLRNKEIAPNTRLPQGADPLKESSYANYTLKDYAPELMFDEITAFVTRSKDKPFFLYWSTPIPHVPLQAPKSWVDYYVKKFGDEKPYLGAAGYFPCRYPRATYAAMVSYLDETVGKLVTQLKELGIYENTLIIFTSDNGPTFNGGSDSVWFNSGGPFKANRGRGKAFLYEGGIRVPFIAAWPGRIKPNSESEHISAFWDALPTLCEVAGVDIPADIDGISYLPTLLQQGTQQKHDYLYWELGANRALRQGKWKALRKGGNKGPVELYDLEADISEQQDLAKQFPDIVKRMTTTMAEARTPPAPQQLPAKP